MLDKVDYVPTIKSNKLFNNNNRLNLLKWTYIEIYIHTWSKTMLGLIKFISCKNTLMFYILFYILGLLYYPVILVIVIYQTTNESYFVLSTQNYIEN